MPKTRIVACLGLGLMVVAAFGSAEAAGRQNPYESAMAAARSEIWQAINSGKCGSATVAITVEGKTVYAEGFGMADRAKSIPVDKNTLFNIGSISKVHVATAIMLLVDDGKVSLDRPVTDYLPEFKMADQRYRKITVRMLLNHASGLPGTEGSNSFGFKYDGNVKKETIETLSRAHLKHDPGAMAVYCNDGFTLAEMIVERASGLSYLTFLDRRIFKPLGLVRTGIGVGDIKGKTAAAYYDPKTGKRHPLETLSLLGAGGLSSTAEELCRFMDAFSEAGRLLKKSSLAEMKKGQPTAFWGKLRNPSLSFGLGWDMTGLPLYDAAGLQLLGKSGGTGNYSSMVFTVPQKRISVAVIAAGRDSGAMKIALDVLEEVLAGRKLMAKKEPSIPIPPQARDLPEDHADFGGYYANGAGLGQVVFDAEKKSVTLYTLKGRERVPAALLVYDDGYYFDTEGNHFYFDRSGEEVYLVSSPHNLAVDMVGMQKVKPMVKPLSLKVDMDDKIWLRRNVSPFEGLMAVDSHFVRSLLHQELPGYVDFLGVKRIEAPDFAAMPFDAMRDQTELTLFEKRGAAWAWVSDMLYSDAQSAAPLKAGENSVKIGKDGYSQWLVAREDGVAAFEKPSRGRVIVFADNDTATYDSAIDRGDVFVAKGSFIELAGLPGDLFTVRIKPVADGKR